MSVSSPLLYARKGRTPSLARTQPTVGEETA
jgi:hypothetical protein